jgi:PHP family Zn ribbon phosphoesterase
MRWYKADLHVHTVLSPCGGLDMSPVNIIRKAVTEKIDILAITDHNSLKHCALTVEIGEKYGITVIPGAEVNTREEIHCLTFFEDLKQAEAFQLYIDAHLLRIPNRPEFFGPQYLVDADENILEEEENLLLAALDSGLEEVEKEVHRLGGLFVPAHVNRMQNGLYSQLGFLPQDLQADALEIAVTRELETFQEEHPETAFFPIITGSDAHSVERIGAHFTEFRLASPNFKALRQVFHGKDINQIQRQ